MSFKAVRPKSSKNLREDWAEDMPPPNLQVLVVDAIEAAGNASKLAKAIGLTRSAVYQWDKRYRNDPYMPIISAIKFLNNRKLKKIWREVVSAKADPD